MPRPQVGDPAPDFTLEGTDGPFTLSAHRGRRVVLLFYPGDDTTVCTKQFCHMRDADGLVQELDATVVGISTQGLASKHGFRAKHGLTTPLLADDDGAVSALYGVLSRRFGIAKRTVIVVDESGRIAHRHTNLLSLTYSSADAIAKVLAELPAR